MFLYAPRFSYEAGLKLVFPIFLTGEGLYMVVVSDLCSTYPKLVFPLNAGASLPFSLASSNYPFRSDLRLKHPRVRPSTKEWPSLYVPWSGNLYFLAYFCTSSACMILGDLVVSALCLSIKPLLILN